MDPLAERVVRRYLVAGLQHELETRFKKLLSYDPGNPPPAEIQEFRNWLASNFKLSGRVPKEGKQAQADLNHLWRMLEEAAQPGTTYSFSKWFGPYWTSRIDRELSNIILYLTAEGTGKAPVFEKKVGSNTYVNMIGASADRFDGLIDIIEKVFSTLKDWHRKALDGGIHVVFAGPKDFRGTASGKYRSEHDQLWIRATAGGRIEKGGAGYGGLAYVIVHELGHRYDKKHGTTFDFDRPEWWTSRYSQNDGESFAELFALSNFGITTYKPEVVAKFETLMTTGKMPV